MKLIIGSDHAGYPLKEILREHLRALGHDVTDVGLHYLPDGSPEDPAFRNYPHVAKTVGLSVAGGEYDRGILVCGTGIGISIAANKLRGIRAAACSNHMEVRFARLHNDINILCLGARVIAPEYAYELCDIYLNTAFEGGRHQMRVDMISQLEDL